MFETCQRILATMSIHNQGLQEYKDGDEETGKVNE